MIQWFKSLSAKARLILLVCLFAIFVVVSLLLRNGVSGPSVQPSETVASVPDPDSQDDDRVIVLQVVESLQASQPDGFDPETYALVEDPSEILPVGAEVTPVEDSLVIDGDSAMVDAIVSAPGSPDSRYWLFLERKNGRWVVTETIGLSP